MNHFSITSTAAALLIGTLAASAPALHAAEADPKPGPAAVTAKRDSGRYIYKDGEPQGRLFLPAKGINTAMLFAQEELRDHLAAIAGKRMERSWRQIKRGEAGILLAVRPEAEWKGKESAQAFTIEEDEVQRRVKITGNTGVAVLYGVYQYLGDLGVRWLAPGDIGTNIPRFGDIPIRPGKRTYSPSFLSRALALSSTPENHFGGTNIKDALYDYQLYLIRNRTQLGRFAVSRGSFGFNICGTGSGHSVKPMTGLTRTEVGKGLMEKEPERFALVTGSDFVQKRRYEGGQVCFTNETNISNAIENCIAHFRKLEETKDERGSDLDEDYTVPMGLSDCFGLCECENCTKIAGREPNRNDRLVWSFWNRVARGLNEKMPGRIMAVHSPYMDLTQPPDDVTIEPNIMVVTPLVFSWEKAPQNKDSYPFPKSFLQWATKTREAGATLGCYNYLNFPWSPTPLLVLDAAQGYARLGYKHYHLESMQRSEYAWPLVWSLAQFTWDSSREPREYLKEFCREYFGMPHDAAILWIFEEMTRNACVMERINFGGAFDTSYMLPDKLIAGARGRLRNAVRQSQGKQQERLSRFTNALEAQFRLAETYRAYCKALNHRTAADLADFEKRARGLEQFWGKSNLKAISTSARTPEVAAGMFLKTDFEALKPAARKDLQGKGPQDKRWMMELFAGARVPEAPPNLFPLPEVWKFNLDYDNKGQELGYHRADYDDREGWQPLSSWNFASSQGYGRQIGGYFWYRVTFKTPAFPAGKKVLLRIGSLDDTGEVYLNGIKVGSQPEPRDWDKSFAMDITETVKPGETNVLAVHGYDSGGGEGVWRPSAIYTE